mgnify:CR=1 FL=1
MAQQRKIFNVIEFFWNLASFVVTLSILVAVHEYGHFWVARKSGVKVERFSVGFGKPLWRRKDKHGTEFVFAAIPFGGYVKMLDERVDEVSEEDKSSAFNNKSVYQRIAIIGAGPFANFLLAAVAFYFVFLIGTPSVKPVIGEVSPKSIAAQAQLPVNSEIIAINGDKVMSWQDVNIALAAKIGGESIEFSVRNSGSTQAKNIILDTRNWQYQPDKEAAFTSLGIVPVMPKVETIITQVAPDSPAEKAGLVVGDKVLTLNGKDVEDKWRELTSTLKPLANVDTRFVVLRNGQQLEIIAVPSEFKRGKEMVGYLGISPTVHPIPEGAIRDISYGPVDAIGQALVKTWQMTVFTFEMIGKLITGDVSVKNLSGPVSIAQGAGSSASHGIVQFLGFLALISINLGIINLLPLPVLDGGHLLYYVIELLTGKPVPEKVQEIGFKFGALALLGLMSIAIMNDISRL